MSDFSINLLMKEKIHVVMECNYFGDICICCCPHKDCSEIAEEKHNQENIYKKIELESNFSHPI